MSTKKIFSWTSKRQSSAEPYYRTGGLLPIDTATSNPNGFEIEIEPKSGRRRPNNLRIKTNISPDQNALASGTASAPYNAALANAAYNLQIAFNEMLRSPVPMSAAACARTVSVHDKPLPRRPRSISAPSTPNLPVELPGSLLQVNQGFPLSVSRTETPALSATESTTPKEDSSPNSDLLLGQESLDLVSELLAHVKSVPDMSARQFTVRSVRSGHSLSSVAGTSTTSSNKPTPQKVQHKRSLSDTNGRKRSRPLLVSSPSPTETKVTTSAELNSNASKTRAGASKMLLKSPPIKEESPLNTPITGKKRLQEEFGAALSSKPSTTRSKHIEELKATITTQDQTISTLQAQFGGLRISHEAHVASLVDTHLAEVASLKNYARVLEAQLAQKTLHHTSSNNLLFLLDTSDPPRTPNREIPSSVGAGGPTPLGIDSLKVTESPHSPQRLKPSPEMENLRRKLSTTKRPETTNRNLLPELNQYKQNNVALQKQIESLMSKLNESKKNERMLRAKMEGIEKEREEWSNKSTELETLTVNAKALQNTIDHLESRLEIANVERLDAQEQIFNIQAQKSPFEIAMSKSQPPQPLPMMGPQDIHLSTSTVFSSGAPTSPDDESRELSTLAAFVSHIEKLQDQVRQKEKAATELETELNNLRMKHADLQQEHHSTTLQSDIQQNLLQRSKHTDSHIEQLRGAIIDREAIVGEKERVIRAMETQMDYHKLLLQSEIRKNAALKIHIPALEEPLPELSSLAGKEDIDRWVDRLHQRLAKENPKSKKSSSSTTAQVESLRLEIDFYIREIMYYKLDIKGYKSDIRKLKRLTNQMSTYGSRSSDHDSETSSIRPTHTPIGHRFATATPELGASGSTSPVMTGPSSTSATVVRTVTPPPTGYSPKFLSYTPQPLTLLVPMTPQTPIRSPGQNLANDSDGIEPGISPRSAERVSPERRKPTPPSPNQEKFGDLLTSFPLSTPAAPQKYEKRRSMSDSSVQPFAAARQAAMLPSSQTNTSPHVHKGRSASVSNATQSKAAPGQHPLSRGGLFDSSDPVHQAFARGNVDAKPRLPVISMGPPFSLQPSPPRPSLPHSRSNSNASSVRVVPPVTPRDFGGLPPNSPVPRSPSNMQSRAGSSASNNGLSQSQAAPLPERQSSVTSNSSVPFVIGMGSPHNPALVIPASNMPPAACSITRNAPLKIQSPTTLTGIGGTMASSNTATTPTSATESWRPEVPPKPTSNKPATITSKFSSHSRNASTPPRHRESAVVGLPRTPSSHSRTVSASSIRTAIRLPKTKERDDMSRVRKDSISLPRPLGSPFDIDRSASRAGQREHVRKGSAAGVMFERIGEAF